MGERFLPHWASSKTVGPGRTVKTSAEGIGGKKRGNIQGSVSIRVLWEQKGKSVPLKWVRDDSVGKTTSRR